MPINIVEKGKNPHLALTHEEQGYSANNRPVSLLMKSGIKLTEELMKSLETLGLSDVSEIKKAASYNTQKDLLRKALEESFCDHKEYEWCYVEDFDDVNVVFWKGCELYQTFYVINADYTVTLGDVANPVIELRSYAVIGGELEINEESLDAIEEGMAIIVMKAFQDKEKSTEIAKSYFSKAKQKKEGDVSLTSDKYAYVPDATKVSTWKLRIDDAEHSAAAAQALSPAGLMGNKVQIPEADLPAVKRKVKAAYKKFHPDATEQTLKDLFKAVDEIAPDNLTTEVSPLNKNKENTMTEVVDFTKSAEYQELQKSLKDMQEELQKAKEEKENIMKAKEAEDKAAMLDVLKGYSFVGDVAEELNEVLFKSAASIKVLEVLEKAQAAISAVVTVEQGQDAPEQIAKSANGDAEKEAVANILKARKAKAKK